jgi:hypothetical protein
MDRIKQKKFLSPLSLAKRPVMAASLLFFFLPSILAGKNIFEPVLSLGSRRLIITGDL